MRISTARPVRRRQSSPSPRQFGWLVVVVAVILGTGFVHFLWRPGSSAVAADAPYIRSGIGNNCLEDRDNSAVAPAYIAPCDHAAAQAWTFDGLSIRHSSRCAGAQQDGSGQGTPISITTCSNAPGQVWLRTGNGLLNPNSGLCLAVDAGNISRPLILSSCTHTDHPAAAWYPSSEPASCQGAEGAKIACYAALEWARWHDAGANHQALLTAYTDGAAYESWCADFISYVYREAGFPFSGGETDGWDENVADNIQHMGFTLHDPATYTPHPGDVAYFDYPGGHVEIVASGGPTPTFIYGDSGTVDPATNNGEMAANTRTASADGALMYYLSPLPR